MSHWIFILIQLLFLAAVFVVPILLLGRKRSIPKNAPRYNRASRITDTLILLAGGCLVFVSIAFLDPDSRLLVLGKLRPAFAATHVVLAVLVVTVILLGAFLTFFGRTSWAVVLTITVLYSYFVCVDRHGFGPSLLMMRIAPKDSWEPIVNYTFELNDTVQGVELWINEVYMGKTPVKITCREFHKKVPFLKTPPKGYKTEGEGNYVDLRIQVVEGEKHGNGAIWYTPDSKHYYAKVKLGNEWSRFAFGQCDNLSGSMVYYDFLVNIPSVFPSRDKVRTDRMQRFENLVQKARLSDYEVTGQWFEVVETYSKGEQGWRDIQRLAENEEGFQRIRDEWVIWKYQIDKKEPEAVFERICAEADASNTYDVDGMAGRAVEMIYERLDVEGLIGRYERSLRLRDRPRSVQVVGHALELFNRKLRDLGDNKDNIIQQRIVPALICWREDVDTAAKFGGSVVEGYLLRQFQREQRVSGFTVLDWKDQQSYQGLHVNKWLFHLCKLDSPAGRNFRHRNRNKVMELVDVVIRVGDGDAREAPEWVFLDIDDGTKSAAYEYWPKYYAAMESSWPGWEYEKLKKRWEYLAKLGSVATFEMYMDCWQKIRMKLMEEHLGGDKLAGAVEVIPRQMRIGVVEGIIRDLEKSIEAKTDKALSDWRKKERRSTGDNSDTATPVKTPGPFRFEEHSYMRALKEYLAGLKD